MNAMRDDHVDFERRVPGAALRLTSALDTLPTSFYWCI